MKTETKSEKKSDYVTRDSVLKLLSDEEVASVSNAESIGRLSNGDEYLDLARIDQGIRRATGPTVPMSRVLPRKSVNDATWTKIISGLGTTARP